MSSVPDTTDSATAERPRYRQKASRPENILLPWWLIETPGLTWSARLIYARLDMYPVGEDGATWIAGGQDRLAAEMGMAVRTVRASLALLEDLGLLVKVERSGDEIRARRCQRYVLMRPDVQPAETAPDQPAEVAPSHAGASRKQEKSTREPDQGRRHDESADADKTPGAEHAAHLCELMADHVEQVTGRRPKVGKQWLREARLLVDANGRSPEEVERAIGWVHRDGFWSANILSMPKLRQKFDTIRVQARNGRGHGRNGHDPDASARAAAAAVANLKAAGFGQ